MNALSPFTEAITFLYTRDLETTARFYEDVLGLRAAVDQGDCLIYRVSAQAFLGFCQRENTPEEPQGVIFTFVSNDVDGWAAHLRSRQIPLEKHPTRYEKYGIYHLFFRDPNGYLLEIQSFEDPKWTAAG